MPPAPAAAKDTRVSSRATAGSTCRAATRCGTDVFKGPQSVLNTGDWIDRPSVGIPYLYVATGMELAEALKTRGNFRRRRPCSIRRSRSRRWFGSTIWSAARRPSSRSRSATRRQRSCCPSRPRRRKRVRRLRVARLRAHAEGEEAVGGRALRRARSPSACPPGARRRTIPAARSFAARSTRGCRSMSRRPGRQFAWPPRAFR